MWNPHCMPSMQPTLHFKGCLLLRPLGENSFFSYLFLVQSTLKPASLLDFIEQLFIETHIASGAILGTRDVMVQTALPELLTIGKASMKPSYK